MTSWSEPRYRMVTVQRHSNAFHWTLVLLTGGAWFLIWPFYRRTHTIKVRSK
jgi:hypothetical protein